MGIFSRKSSSRTPPAAASLTLNGAGSRGYAASAPSWQSSGPAIPGQYPQPRQFTRARCGSCFTLLEFPQDQSTLKCGNCGAILYFGPNPVPSAELHPSGHAEQPPDQLSDSRQIAAAASSQPVSQGLQPSSPGTPPHPSTALAQPGHQVQEVPMETLDPLLKANSMRPIRLSSLPVVDYNLESTPPIDVDAGHEGGEEVADKASKVPLGRSTPPSPTSHIGLKQEKAAQVLLGVEMVREKPDTDDQPMPPLLFANSKELFADKKAVSQTRLLASEPASVGDAGTVGKQPSPGSSTGFSPSPGPPLAAQTSRLHHNTEAKRKAGLKEMYANVSPGEKEQFIGEGDFSPNASLQSVRDAASLQAHARSSGSKTAAQEAMHRNGVTALEFSGRGLHTTQIKDTSELRKPEMSPHPSPGDLVIEEERAQGPETGDSARRRTSGRLDKGVESGVEDVTGQPGPWSREGSSHAGEKVDSAELASSEESDQVPIGQALVEGVEATEGTARSSASQRALAEPHSGAVPEAAASEGLAAAHSPASSASEEHAAQASPRSPAARLPRSTGPSSPATPSGRYEQARLAPLVAKIPRLVANLANLGPAREQAALELAYILEHKGSSQEAKESLVLEIITCGGVPALVGLWANQTTGEREREAARAALVAISLSSGDAFAAVLLTLRERSTQTRTNFRVPWLVVLLSSGTGVQKQRTMRTLEQLLQGNSTTALELCKAGAVPRLLTILQGSEEVETCTLAARLLAALAAEAECGLELAAERGLVADLVAVVRDTRPACAEARAAAASALAKLAACQQNKVHIASVDGAVGSLLEAVLTNEDPELKGQVLDLLLCLSSHPMAAGSLASHAELLVEVLRSSSGSQQQEAFAILANLAQGSEEDKLMLLEARAGQELVQLLGSSSLEGQQLCLQALASLGVSVEALGEVASVGLARVLLQHLQVEGSNAGQQGPALAMLLLLADTPQGLAALEAAEGFLAVLDFVAARSRLLGPSSSPPTATWPALEGASRLLAKLAGNMQSKVAFFTFGAVVELLKAAAGRQEGQTCVGVVAPPLTVLLARLEDEPAWIAEARQSLLGCSALLVGGLEGGTESTRAGVAELLTCLVDMAEDEAASVLCRAGAVPSLLHVLRHGGPEERAQAVLALCLVCPPAPIEVVEHGGLPLLLAVVDDAVGAGEAERLGALQVVGVLADNDLAREAMLREELGVVSAVAALLVEEVEQPSSLPHLAVVVLGALAQSEEYSELLCAEAGAVAALVALAQRSPAGSAEKEEALLALGNIAHARMGAVKDCLLKEGALLPLIAALGQANQQGQAYAAMALGNLGGGSDARKTAIVVGGAVGPLVALLCSEEPAGDEASLAREEAAYALSVLVRVVDLRPQIAHHLPLDVLLEQLTSVRSKKGREHLQAVRQCLTSVYDGDLDEDDLT